METNVDIYDYLSHNLMRLYIIEKINIPVLNILHPWKPFTINEFELLLKKTKELEIGVESVMFYNENLQKYNPYNLEISGFILKDPKEYNKILDHIIKINELYPEKVTHLSVNYDIPYQKLIDYQNAVVDLDPMIYHDEAKENDLLSKIKLDDQDALKQLINLYRIEILSISKKYLEYNFDPIQEAIIVFYRASSIYNEELHGEFLIYITKWITNFVHQSALESKR